MNELKAFLALRPDEMIHFSEMPYDQQPYYAVMLIETLPFPGVQHEESANLAVVCAAQYATERGVSGDEPRWGWVHIEAGTKEIIGAGLESIGAVPGQWYCMLISGGLGHRPRDHFQVNGE